MAVSKKELSIADYTAGIRSRDRTLLGRAITLIESSAPDHREQADALLTELMPDTGKSIRLGISGIPGSGKSTLIETLGLHIVEQGHRLAVLAVDPSSSISGGSILGDKTRMPKLARSEHSFIRPSPTGGTLGGVARKTRETMLLCEAAGYDVIIVETVGVGQSEIAVRSMVDFFLLLQITGGGDELQGIKKGVMELADAIFITKADGDNKKNAEAAKRDLRAALHFIQPATPGWQPLVGACSALTGDGIEELWQTMMDFRQNTSESCEFASRRREQAKAWLHELIEENLKHMFMQHSGVKSRLADLEKAVVSKEMPAGYAARELLRVFRDG